MRRRSPLVARLILGATFVTGPALAAEPTLLQDARPEYPPEALADRVTGTVVLRLSLDATGAVTASEVLQSVRADLDEAAAVAARRLRFALDPAVPTTVDYAFTFALDVQDQQGNAVPGSFVVHLQDPDGVGIPGAIVTLVHHGEPRATRSVESDADGDVRAAFLPPGDWTFSITRSGFAPTGGEVTLGSGETREASFTLTPAGPTESVVVIGLRQRWREVSRAARQPDPSPVTGAYQLTRRDVESTPGALEDVTRAVHKLPGVASDGDMLGTFSVRGATSSEVVFLLDRVPLDNPFHLAGFNSIFNPDMLEKVDFFAGAAPSPYPDSTSAVMDVQSWDGSGKDDRNDLDGAIDVSMSTARAFVLGPIGKQPAPDPDAPVSNENGPAKPPFATFAVAARRSYLEGYFGAMKALNLLDTAVAAPEYGELSARLALRPAHHRILLTALATNDHLALVDSDDASTITIDGTFKLDDTVYLTALDDLWQLGGDATLESTVAYTYDTSKMERDFGGAVNRDVTRQQAWVRSDLSWPLADKMVLGAGVAGALTSYQYAGPVEDTRATPTWAALPIADRGLELIELTPGPAKGTLAGYVDHRWDGPVRTRAGVRVTGVQRTGEVLVSPSAGLSVPLPTGTIPKLSGGIYHHLVEDPLVVDPVYGNPDVRAERSYQVVAGVDQGLPIGKGGLLRVEAYYAALDHLVVNPDNTAAIEAGTTFENAGSGHNAGVDLLFAAQTERLSFAVNGSFLDAVRTNPLNEVYAQTYVPSQAQAVTAGASVEWQATPHWRFTGRYDFHTGRPMSAVAVGADDTVVETSLNDERLGDFHQVDVRAEWRKATARLRWSVYLEVLNVFNLHSDFLPIVSVADGTLDTTMFSHLPIRPFLGIRADF